MTDKELVMLRKSVRTYDGNALSEEDKKRITDYMSQCTDPYDIPVEYRLLDAKEYGLTSPVIADAKTYIAGKLRRTAHAEEAFGYSFEKLLLYACSIGLGNVIIGGTMNRDAFEKAMELGSDEVMPCVSPLGRAADKRSVKESLMRKGIRADSRLKDTELFFTDSFDRPVTETEVGELKDAYEMVRWAPSAVNKQPWRLVRIGDKMHFYEKKSRGYIDATGFDMQKIDMGIALYHFELGAKAAGFTPVFEINEPDLIHPADTEYIATYIIN